VKNFDIDLVAGRLTAYAIERQNSFERYQPQGTSPWAASRRFWTDAILQGMVRLEGGTPTPALMERFDQELKSARGSAATVPASPKLQRGTIRALRNFVSALEATGDDRRRQVDVVRELLEDMSSHLPWAHAGNRLDLACDEAEHALRRMTAQMPIRFTRILLGGDAGPHWASGYASGTVTDAEAVQRTAIYQEAVRDYPEITSWPALCTVYVGGNQPSALGAVDASDFDLEIMNLAGDGFLKERGIRWTCGMYQMTVPGAQSAAAPEKTRTEEIQAEEVNPLLLGERPLEPDDLAIFELYASEDDCLTFCLDVLADEKTVFGRQLSDEREESYIMTYVVYDEGTGAVRDTMDVELRLPHDEKWFHCKLPDEVRAALKEKMDTFCLACFGEHLPGTPAQCQEEADASQMEPTM